MRDLIIPNEVIWMRTLELVQAIQENADRIRAVLKRAQTEMVRQETQRLNGKYGHA